MNSCSETGHYLHLINVVNGRDNVFNLSASVHLSVRRNDAITSQADWHFKHPVT